VKPLRGHNGFAPADRPGTVRVVHVPGAIDDGIGRRGRTVASDVDVADTLLSRAKGLMGRSSVPADYALVFPFGSPGKRWIHTWLVRTPIDVVWTVEDEVVRVETMRAWFGLAAATADAIYEFRAGGAEGVEPGDVLRVEE
jgi:uncharacterized membrane protein (UPF0127 family)